MKTTGDVVRERYQKHIRDSEQVTRTVALFALQMACADIEEVWQDEYAATQRQIGALKAQIETLEYTVEGLRQALATQIDLVELERVRGDAWETECRLHGKMG